jgi:hypothetical protein
VRITRRRRTRRVVENHEFASFARRIIRAFGRRVAAGDVDALADLVAMRDAIDEALVVAVAGLSERGYSYADMAARLGCTRQNVWAQWGRKVTQDTLTGLLAWQQSKQARPDFANPRQREGRYANRTGGARRRRGSGPATQRRAA